MRILPRNNDAVNEEWISDKTRHVADGLRTQRLDQPYVRRDGKLVPASWAEALSVVADKLTAADRARVGAIVGDLAGAEEMFALGDLLARLGIVSGDCRQDGCKIDPTLGRAGYLFNSTIEGIEQADAILLIGANPRLEAAVLNARIRKRWRQGGLKLAMIGERADVGYPFSLLSGDGAQALTAFIENRYDFAREFAAAKRPMVIVGAGAVARADGAAVLAAAATIATTGTPAKDAGWNAFNILHTAASRVAGLDLGFVPGPGGRDVAGMLQGDMQVVYLLGADEIDMAKLGRAFVVYQGTHGDAGAHRADVILPGAAYTEKCATYVNLEGRVQMTEKAAFAPGEAKEDWTILRALSERAGHALPYDTLGALRAEMYAVAPILQRLDVVAAATTATLDLLARSPGKLDAQPFTPAITNYYLTNSIARASAIMAELSQLKAGSATRAAAE